jgi:D-alanyl-D-alanine carboxypeptidase
LKNTIESSIKDLFSKQVQKDSRIKNAFLLVHSEQVDLHVNIAEGNTGDVPSVGKLFTSVMIGMLHEQGTLTFGSKISRYLDRELMKELHLFKGTDYSDDIEIRHLLNQTSGLPDNFYPLFDRLLKDPEFTITPRGAIEWAKQNLTPSAPPGKKAYYTDTNYHILGLIVENVTGTPFHKALKEMIFSPLGMKHASMLHASEPMVDPKLPIADFYADQTKVNDLKGFAGIDYA